MMTREEKNKEVVNELNKEKAINISKKILHIISIVLLIFILFFAYIYFIGVKGLKTKEYVIKDNLIPNSFNGIKILHFTDLLYEKYEMIDSFHQIIGPDGWEFDYYLFRRKDL